MDFLAVLVATLQVDYLMIMANIRGMDELSFPIPKEMYEVYKNQADALGVSANYYESTEPDSLILEFDSLDDQERMLDSMRSFNHSFRETTNIPMPDIYAGQEAVDIEICSVYLGNIADFFRNEFEGHVLIPIAKRAENKSAEQEYAVFSKDGAHGSILKSQIESS